MIRFITWPVNDLKFGKSRLELQLPPSLILYYSWDNVFRIYRIWGYSVQTCLYLCLIPFPNSVSGHVVRKMSSKYAGFEDIQFKLVRIFVSSLSPIQYLVMLCKSEQSGRYSPLISNLSYYWDFVLHLYFIISLQLGETGKTFSKFDIWDFYYWSEIYKRICQNHMNPSLHENNEVIINESFPRVDDVFIAGNIKWPIHYSIIGKRTQST